MCTGSCAWIRTSLAPNVLWRDLRAPALGLSTCVVPDGDHLVKSLLIDPEHRPPNQRSRPTEAARATGVSFTPPTRNRRAGS